MTENEFKFVIKDCEEEIARMAEKKYLIEQGYLLVGRGISLRFRKSQNDSKNSYFMTFKCSAGGRVIEIEKKLDYRDFHDLWPQCMNKLEKIRYVLDGWDIDFFKDHNNETYFAMAELELPEGEVPGIIPDFIESNLLHKVELTDCRFSSKILGDVRYAKNLYSKLGKTYEVQSC